MVGTLGTSPSASKPGHDNGWRSIGADGTWPFFE